MTGKIIDAEQMNECLKYVAELRKQPERQEREMTGKVVRSWVK